MDFQVSDDDLPLEPPRKRIGRPKGSFVPRMNDVQRRQFIKDSVNIILNQHLSYGEYCEWVKQQKGISRNQANEYWLKSWAILKKKFEMEKDKLILKHIKNYWDIYETALINSDLTNARQVLNDLAKLQGLNEPDKVEVSGTQIKLNFGNAEGNND
jgi:hypothetical protein